MKPKTPSPKKTKTVRLLSFLFFSHMLRQRSPLLLREQERALLNAATFGDLLEVDRLLSAKPHTVDPDVQFTRSAVSSKTPTPLMRASEYGHSHIVNRLLASFAGVNTVSGEDSCTPLMVACKKGNAKIVEILITGGADVHREDKAGGTALLYAMQNGFGTNIEARLRAAGATLTLKNKGLLLMWAAQHGSRLIKAAKDGKPGVVSWLIRLGVDVNSQDEEMFTALNWASFYGYADIVDALIGAGANANTPNAAGFTPVMGAIINGHKNVEEELLAAGAAEPQVEQTCLLAELMAGNMVPSARNGMLEDVKRLIKYGVDVNVPDATKRTALIEASANGHIQVAAALIDAFANVNAAMHGGAPDAVSGRTALVEASANGHREIVAMLLEAGAQVNVIGNTSLVMYSSISAGDIPVEHGVGAAVGQNSLALYSAVSGGYDGVADDLRRAGATLSKHETDKALSIGWERLSIDLFCAAAAGVWEKVYRLVEISKVNVNVEDEKGSTPLMHAAFNGHTKAVSTLVYVGALVNKIDARGDTPLYYAIKGGHEQVGELLRSLGGFFSTDDMPVGLLGEHLLDAAGAGHMQYMARLLAVSKLDVDYAAESDHWTALMEACSKGYLTVVEFLLEAGANINQTNIDGCTPLFFALEGHHDDLVVQLCEKGAAFSNEDEERLQVDLLLAATDGDLESVDRLLKFGIEPDAELCGTTAIMAAFCNGHRAVVKRMLSAGAVVNKKQMRVELAGSMLSLCSEEAKTLQLRVANVRKRTVACAIKAAVDSTFNGGSRHQDGQAYQLDARLHGAEIASGGIGKEMKALQVRVRAVKVRSSAIVTELAAAAAAAAEAEVQLLATSRIRNAEMVSGSIGKEIKALQVRVQAVKVRSSAAAAEAKAQLLAEARARNVETDSDSIAEEMKALQVRMRAVKGRSSTMVAEIVTEGHPETRAVQVASLATENSTVAGNTKTLSDSDGKVLKMLQERVHVTLQAMATAVAEHASSLATKHSTVVAATKEQPEVEVRVRNAEMVSDSIVEELKALEARMQAVTARKVVRNNVVTPVVNTYMNCDSILEIEHTSISGLYFKSHESVHANILDHARMTKAAEVESDEQTKLCGEPADGRKPENACKRTEPEATPAKPATLHPSFEAVAAAFPEARLKALQGRARSKLQAMVAGTVTGKQPNAAGDQAALPAMKPIVTAATKEQPEVEFDDIGKVLKNLHKHVRLVMADSSARMTGATQQGQPKARLENAVKYSLKFIHEGLQRAMHASTNRASSAIVQEGYTAV